MSTLDITPALAARLALCRQGDHIDVVTLVGIHSIADNETVKWCRDCGSVIFTVLEGPPKPDLKPKTFTRLFD
ncbi:hypothetical protein A2V54_00350 [candidate division WWE3 bacterium RBG_19FT_COMBO_53_11]|uniref:Uncharacterized protein n=1 Tax=candidate division WWE3 bacterium RBG_19FT_COMBO_53_11 TaxID=1802613 RepID=A0A1F4UHR2_UNCKA|nr:MAG: hypothetical protein A2V54_00350 [candidate division WWE3 bacterium RBG_19FT_COMBO_53_11]